MITIEDAERWHLLSEQIDAEVRRWRQMNLTTRAEWEAVDDLTGAARQLWNAWAWIAREEQTHTTEDP
jgi:hypothetical protein